MNILSNVYFVLFFLILGPEAVAKSLPMKKVQTVETVWMPMTQGEVDESTQAIESVEIEEGHQGAVPLFKEAQSPVPPPSREDPRPKLVSQEPPGVAVQTVPGQGPGQRPVIQVIYQDVKPPSPPAEKEVPQLPRETPIATQKMDPIEEDKPSNSPEKKEKMKGDVYNFYFSS